MRRKLYSQRRSTSHHRSLQSSPTALVKTFVGLPASETLHGSGMVSLEQPTVNSRRSFMGISVSASYAVGTGPDNDGYQSDSTSSRFHMPFHDLTRRRCRFGTRSGFSTSAISRSEPTRRRPSIQPETDAILSPRIASIIASGSRQTLPTSSLDFEGHT